MDASEICRHTDVPRSADCLRPFLELDAPNGGGFNTQGTPRVYFTRREVSPDELTDTADGLALIGDEFADDMKGWALVHVRNENCSTQTAVTQCTYYKQFTTEEALQEAATSFGGLTKDIQL